MIALLLTLATVVSVWIWWKSSRLDNRAGRNSAKPVYQIEPPARRVGSRRTETL